MGRGHGVAGPVFDAANQKKLGGKLVVALAVSMRGERRLHVVPGGRMLALVGLALMGEPPGIDRVREDLVEVATAERLPAPRPTCPVGALGNHNAFSIKARLEGADAAER